jgi:hypothetical protein
MGVVARIETLDRPRYRIIHCAVPDGAMTVILAIFPRDLIPH